MSPPDPRDGGRMDAHFLGHETATPVRGVCGLLLEGLADDLRFVVRSDLAGVDPSVVGPRAALQRHLPRNRSSHCVTVGLDTPTSRQIADPDRPSAEQRTMLALSTTRCGVVRLFTNRSKRLRSPRRNRILRTGSPMRGIYRMYLLCIRFPLHYTRLSTSPINSSGVVESSGQQIVATLKGQRSS